MQLLHVNHFGSPAFSVKRSIRWGGDGQTTPTACGPSPPFIGSAEEPPLCDEACYNAGHIMQIRRLSRDDWNIEHVARHAVTQDEVEAVCHGDRSPSSKATRTGSSSSGWLPTVVSSPR